MAKHELWNVAGMQRVHVHGDAFAVVPHGDDAARTIYVHTHTRHTTGTLHVVGGVDEDFVEYLEQCSGVRERPPNHAVRGSVEHWHFAVRRCDTAHIRVRTKEHVLNATL